MQFPLTFWDISLWLAVTAIILLVEAELISPHYGHTSLIINRKRVRALAVAVCILFLFTVLVRIYGIITAT
ncbi:MAG: hypothetical protein JSV85_06975 [Candidatus Bathyarchaeota archaeon]|nr:MAG: hypothetical protein JSV85_06975 [Candidatus Bathyarchaeota archaeon]